MVTAARLLLTILFVSAQFARADMCFRSPDGVNIEGMPGQAAVFFMWSDQGDAFDEIRFDGGRFRAGSSLRCGNTAPITCRLSEDAGAFRLVFEGNKVRIISTGFSVSIFPNRPKVSLKRGLLTIVHELVQLTDAQCRVAFPVRRKIEVFPDRPEAPFTPVPTGPSDILR